MFHQQKYGDTLDIDRWWLGISQRGYEPIRCFWGILTLPIIVTPYPSTEVERWDQNMVVHVIHTSCCLAGLFNVWTMVFLNKFPHKMIFIDFTPGSISNFHAEGEAAVDPESRTHKVMKFPSAGFIWVWPEIRYMFPKISQTWWTTGPHRPHHTVASFSIWCPK